MIPANYEAFLEQVERFVERVRAFCALIENYEAFTPIASTRKSAAMLSRLYEAGLGLPEVPMIREEIIGDHLFEGRMAKIL